MTDGESKEKVTKCWRLLGIEKGLRLGLSTDTSWSHLDKTLQCKQAQSIIIHYKKNKKNIIW